jgi:hypothetical protein
MTRFVALAASVTDVLTHLLRHGADKGCEVLAEGTAKALIEAIKRKLHSATARKALRELAATPDTADRQKSFSRQLNEMLTNDSKLEGELEAWLRVASPLIHRQTATASGKATVIQIQGSGNSVR